MRAMAALWLDSDFNALAADDKVRPKLQDLAPEAPRRTTGSRLWELHREASGHREGLGARETHLRWRR